MKKKFHKNIENEIQKINSFLLSETFLIEQNEEFPLNNSEITLKKVQEKNSILFDLKLKIPQNPNEITFKKLGFNTDFKLISDKNLFLIPARSANRLVGKSLVPTNNLKGEFGTIYSEKFPVKSNSIFRSLLNIGKESLTTIFLGQGYSCGKNNYALGLIVFRNRKFGFSRL